MAKATDESSDNDELELSPIATTDRRLTEKRERRKRVERRGKQVPVALDRREGDRRAGERRRQIDPTTCEREYDAEELEFMRAIESYKRDFRRPFPTWSEVLEVAKSIGYRKVAEHTAIVANRSKATPMNDVPGT